MFRIRTPRIGVVGAAATVALAGFALTACTGGPGTSDTGAAKDAAAVTSTPAAAPTATPSAAVPSAPSASTPPAKAAGSRPAGGSSATKAPNPASKSVTCDGSDTKVVAAPVSRPVNHMLLTVTNTGSKTCYLYGYPALQFAGAQAVPSVIEDSHPQAVTTLGPGESGYASVILSAGDGSGTNGRTVKSLTIWFSGRSGTGSTGAAAHPSLPAQGVHIDDSLRTTYWEQSMDDALAW
ncbi:Protein of unknown function [Actinacidiphila yanglinensis]|uniref:DUF4232 domain-containing protein n=1 Tax=Actinacidiphila yanglinensis TaxID=310779 RepID=A0A1H6EDT4_9ACTN|nr:DUF4232 domain-containing protein [Actinacidiphila yanglinensis]SEG95116.1 Protein of unknown function [Actinacidiphila yanglinensis]